ncbi:nucleotidyltransferase [Pseudomonas phage phi15]|uniref:Putative nucleotidyl transferase n=1 Tax=Pseudomonas phage phi15 TaxID=988656 RepID=F0V6Y4_9CAUD|nr:nucleotidyltransferase [Pseudomonas phage phi15]CBZ41996.1 putative nucleotidyl transferase [Pseudomonas phage phi15]
MSATRDDVIRAINLRDQLEALGFSVVIAGGFCRDVYFGEPPKDIDIVVAGANREDPMASVALALATLEVTCQAFHVYNGASSDRLIGGFKCTGNVDVVVYDIRDALDSPEHFDFNLNQFMLKGADFESAYVYYVGDTSWHEGLVPVRQDYSDDRRNKMREKWLNLTWRFPEGSGPARVHLKDAVFHNPDL